MTEYRALLIGIESERPIQTISHSRADIEQWIESQFRHYAKATAVEIYRSKEELIETRLREKSA